MKAIRKFLGLFALVAVLFTASQAGLTPAVEAGPAPPPNGEPQLYYPQTVTGQSVALRQWKFYSIDIPAGVTKLTITTANGSGDADLYLRAGTKPTLSAYNCRSKNIGNNETCVVNNPAAAMWWIGVYGYAAASYTISTAVAAPVVAAGDVALNNAETLDGQIVAQNQWRYYSIVVPAGQTRLAVSTTNATGDADLYVRLGAKPTKTLYNCKKTGIGGNETCVINNPAAGTWWIGVFGYNAASFSVNATIGNVDDATFVSEGAPLDGVHFAAGESFQKCWTVRNTGNTTWAPTGNPSYSVTRTGGLYGPASIVLAGNIGPGVNVAICANFTAPAAPGTHRATYTLESSLTGAFGDEFWVEIVVDP